MYQVHFLFDTLMGAVWLVFDVDEGPNDRVIVPGVYRCSGPISYLSCHMVRCSPTRHVPEPIWIIYFLLCAFHPFYAACHAKWKIVVKCKRNFNVWTMLLRKQMITFLDFIIHILRCRVVTREDYRRSGILYSFSKYAENPGKYSR